MQPVGTPLPAAPVLDLEEGSNMHKTVREIVYDLTAKPHTEQATIMAEFGFEPVWDDETPFADQRNEFFNEVRERGQSNAFINYLRETLEAYNDYANGHTYDRT